MSDTPQMAEPKLLVTVAAKVNEDLARQFRRIAQASGMSDSQVFRLLLERAGTLFEEWDPRVNLKFFISQFQIQRQQPNLFSFHERGNSRSKR